MSYTDCIIAALYCDPLDGVYSFLHSTSPVAGADTTITFEGGSVTENCDAGYAYPDLSVTKTYTCQQTDRSYSNLGDNCGNKDEKTFKMA